MTYMLQHIQLMLRQHIAQFTNPYSFKEAAIFIPLVKQYDEIYLLFEVRANTLSYQPGQICFPGGKIEAQDQSKYASACRELTEELGIEATQILFLGELDYFCSPLGYIIYPFCGQLLDITTLHTNPSEVESIFLVPLQWFMDHSPNTQLLTLGSQFDSPVLPFLPSHIEWLPHNSINVLYYCYEDKIIWGLTAEIIQQLLNKITPLST